MLSAPNVCDLICILGFFTQTETFKTYCQSCYVDMSGSYWPGPTVLMQWPSNSVGISAIKYPSFYCFANI